MRKNGYGNGSNSPHRHHYIQISPLDLPVGHKIQELAAILRSIFPVQNVKKKNSQIRPWLRNCIKHNPVSVNLGPSNDRLTCNMTNYELHR